MNKKGLFQNQSGFKRAYAKIIHNVLRRHKFTRLSFIILSFLEMLQLIYFSFFPGFQFNNNFPYIDQITYILGLLNSDRYMYDPTLFLSFLTIGTLVFNIEYILISILFLVFVRLANVIIKNSYWGEYQLIDELGLELINIFLILIKTVAFIPWCFAIMYSFRIFQLNWFAIQYNILIFFISFAIMSIFISFTFMSTSHFVYRNPFAESYMSGPKNRNSELKIIARIMLVIYWVFDPKITNQTAFLVYSYILNSFMLYRIYFYQSYYDKLLDKINLLFYFFPFYIQTLVILHIFIPNNELSFICFGGILSLLIVIYMFTIRAVRIQKAIYKQIKFKRQSQLLNFVYGLIDGIKYKMLPQYYIRLSGTLRHHSQICEIIDCKCKKAVEAIKIQTFQQFFVYNFLSSLLFSYLDYQEFNDRTALLAGYISNWKQQIVSKSLFYLDNAIKSIPPIPQLCTETCVYREMLMIEDSMKKNDIRNIKNLDFNKFYDFQKGVSLLEGLIQQNVSLTLRFWQEIQYDNTNYKNIRQLGNEIIKGRAEIEKKHKQMQQNNIYKQKLQVYIIYGIFIIGAEGYEKLIKNFQTNISGRQLKNYFTREQQQQIIDEKSIVVLSGNIDSNFGGIVYCNRYMKNFFGYTFKDLENKNIKILMPEIIAQKHDEILSKYFLKQRVNKKKEGMLITAVDINGFLVPCFLVQKILPKLDKGIQIVGFINLVKEESKFNYHYLLYRSDTKSVIAISKQLNQKLGVQANKKIQDVFDNWDNTTQIQQMMRSKDGYLTAIKNEQEIEINPIYGRKQNVLLKMKWEMFFYNLHLRLVTVYEQKSIGGFSKSKLFEAISFGARSNISILTEPNTEMIAKQQYHQNEINAIKVLQLLIIIIKLLAFIILYIMFYLKNNTTNNILNEISNKSNLSNSISETTFHLRNIQLTNYYNNYSGIDLKLSQKLLAIWQDRSRLSYYDLLKTQETLSMYGSHIIPQIYEIFSNISTEFEHSFQNYITNLKNIINSKQDFSFNPNLETISYTPTFFKFYKIIKNSDLYLMKNSLVIRSDIQNKLIESYKNFNVWLIIGIGIGIILIILIIKCIYVERLKKKLDKAIQIFSTVKNEEVTLIIDNCSIFLDYYFANNTRIGEPTNLQTNINSNEDERLNKNDNTALQILRRQETNYFQKITIYLIIFFIFTAGIFSAFGYVNTCIFNQSITSFQIESKIESRINYINFMRTYSIESIFDNQFQSIGLQLINYSFINQRQLLSTYQNSNLHSFSSYYKAIDTGNACDFVSSNLNCSKINGGILNIGVSNALSSYMQMMRQIFSSKSKNKQPLELLSNQNYQILYELMDILTELSRLIVENLRNNYTIYLNIQFLNINIIGICFILYTILTIFMIWLPLSKVLQNQSNWNKNFMNLIPYQTLITSGKTNTEVINKTNGQK